MGARRAREAGTVSVTTLQAAALLAAFLYALFLAYVVVMGLYRAHLQKRLGRTLKVLGAPVLLLGALMDVLVNLTLACIVFLDLPREFMLTVRLQRYMRGGGWRRSWADWLCTKLLDPFDPSGSHCM